jgi:hypothetical protein
VGGEEVADAATDARGGVAMRMRVVVAVVVVRVGVLVFVVMLVAHVGPLPVRGWTYGAHRAIMCV